MTQIEPYRVHVVGDPRFGDRLLQLPEEEPAWVVDTQENRSAIQECWRRRPGDHLQGVTAFRPADAGIPESRLIELLADLDLHHGKFSHDPPYSIVIVYEIHWSGQIAGELRKYGFLFLEAHHDGFIARRQDETA